MNKERLLKLKEAVKKWPDHLFDYNNPGPSDHTKEDCGCAYHVAMACGIIPKRLRDNRFTDFQTRIAEAFDLNDDLALFLFNNECSIPHKLAVGKEGKKIFFTRLREVMTLTKRRQKK